MMEHYSQLLEAEIKRQSFGSHPKSLYEPIRYIMALGGKRLRPLLTLLSYSLFRSDVEKIVPYAVAIEAFHNFTLLHDDIMDNAPLRRGRATVHKKWSINTAILSGDVMLVKVYEMFAALDEKKLKEVISLFNACATEVCQGQQLDMEFETRKKVTEAQYIDMIRQKTAVLLGFSLELGALLADASAEDRTALNAFGVNIGIGFQLKDDLLDVYGSQQKFGKQVGGDILANKKTFLLIRALELARGKDKLELVRWLSSRRFSKPKKIKSVTAIYNNLGIQQSAEKKIAEFFNKGFESLHRIKSGQKENLISFTRDLVHRQS